MHRTVHRGMTSLRIAARIAGTRAEGPGSRYAVWLQGCSIRCPGCCNPQLLDPAGGEAVGVDHLLGEIDHEGEAIEGVTVLGGEPFDQPAGLAALARGVRERGLGVIIFSGYTLAELRERPDESVRSALAATDLLVDGRYDLRLPEPDRLWVGSTNQRFHYLTRRYHPSIERDPSGRPSRITEIRITPSGEILANGWPLGQAQGSGLLLCDVRPSQ
jgi:anaerobic ribonucleoside-triphosphate reductase activating protein